jgi:hypothetical protein
LVICRNWNPLINDEVAKSKRLLWRDVWVLSVRISLHFGSKIRICFLVTFTKNFVYKTFYNSL